MLLVVLVLAGCRAPVIGMEIVAEVGCEPTEAGGTCPALDLTRLPCRCNVHHFDRDAGFVEVWDERLEDGAPAVVFALDYASEFPLCGADLLVRDEAVTIGAAGSADALYTVDSAAALTPVPDAPLSAEAGDTLTFVYPTEGGTVTETHTVTFREAMDVHPVPGVPCCGTEAAPSMLAAVAGMALVGRRRGRWGRRRTG